MTPALIVASLLTLASAKDPAVASTPHSPAVTESCMTLPGMPRTLAARLEAGQVVVTWDAPSSSGCTGLTGYVVVASTGESFVVDAGTTHATLVARPHLRVSVAAMNEVGSSARTHFVAPATALSLASVR